MEIRKLEVFCKVVELKSFTLAAEAVLLSQPTVSEHVRNLEQELEQKLVDRLNREVTPTPVGLLLYDYARKILRTRQEAIQAVKQFSGTLVGRIMIGCGTIPGTYILPKLIHQFRQQYPSIKATLRITSSQIIAKMVLDGHLELGVVGAKWNENKLEWIELFSDELILAVHPNHHWAQRNSVPLHEVVKEPFILREPESGTRQAFAQVLKKHELKESDIQEIAEIGSTAAVKEAVKAGIGVAILSQYAVKDDVACGRLVAIQIEEHRMQRPFYLIKRKNKALPPVASTFFEYLQSCAE